MLIGEGESCFIIVDHIVAKPNGKIFIGDVNDIEKLELALELRANE